MAKVKVETYKNEKAPPVRPQFIAAIVTFMLVGCGSAPAASQSSSTTAPDAAKPVCAGTYQLSGGTLDVQVSTVGPAAISVVVIDSGQSSAEAVSEAPAGASRRAFQLTVDPPVKEVDIQVIANMHETDCQAVAG